MGIGELEGNAPVSRYLHGPLAFPVPSHLVQARSRKTHIFDPYGGVEQVQYVAYLLSMPGLDSFFAAIVEKIFQSLVGNVFIIYGLPLLTWCHAFYVVTSKVTYVKSKIVGLCGQWRKGQALKMEKGNALLRVSAARIDSIPLVSVLPGHPAGKREGIGYQLDFD